MMLRGMGFDNSTLVYVAAGVIYKAEKYMAPLRKLFPLLETKDTLATPEELAPFQVYTYYHGAGIEVYLIRISMQTA